MQLTNDKLIITERLAYLHGLLKLHDGSPRLLSCTMFPSPFPKAVLDFAESLQPEFNLLFHKVALDHEFLDRIFKHIADHDDYVKHLWDIYSRVRGTEHNKQVIFLGLNRSDYMLDQGNDAILSTETSSLAKLHRIDTAASYPISTDSWSGLTLRQVEFNLMASSFCGLGPRLVKFHRAVLGLNQFRDEQIRRVPDCSSAEKFATAIGFAHKLYMQSTSGLNQSERGCGILMIVSSDETNIFDQTAILEELALKHPHIPLLVRTLVQLEEPTEGLSVDSSRRLFVQDQEIAVVYFRSGYSPLHFPRERTWEVKYHLERSLAVKCPCIQYMLANTKLVQAALSKPENLARFINPASDVYQHVLGTFAKQFTLSDAFGLSDAVEIQEAVNHCLKHPERYVLKPQREGGGNNYFDAELVRMLSQITSTDERRSYILMQRLYPTVVENYKLDSTGSLPHPENIVSELGIFGTFVACVCYSCLYFVYFRL